MCFFSYCLTEQDFLLRRVSSLSCSCKGTLHFILYLYSLFTCSQNRLGKQRGPGAAERGCVRPARITVVLTEGAAHGRKDVRLLIPPKSIWQGRTGASEEPWSFAVIKCSAGCVFPALSSQKYLSGTWSRKGSTPGGAAWDRPEHWWGCWRCNEHLHLHRALQMSCAKPVLCSASAADHC